MAYVPNRSCKKEDIFNHQFGRATKKVAKSIYVQAVCMIDFQSLFMSVGCFQSLINEKFSYMYILFLPWKCSFKNYSRSAKVIKVLIPWAGKLTCPKFILNFLHHTDSQPIWFVFKSPVNINLIFDELWVSRAFSAWEAG